MEVVGVNEIAESPSKPSPNIVLEANTQRIRPSQALKPLSAHCGQRKGEEINMNTKKIKQNNTVRMICGILMLYFLTGVSIVSPGNIYGQDLTLSITEPTEGSRVCMQNMVRGTVSNPNLQVFVLIHPMATDRFWVQPLPERGSNWHTYCFFGEPNRGVGEPFEIIAVASANRSLFQRGDTLTSPLPNNPQILVRSRPVIVTRDPCLHR